VAIHHSHRQTAPTPLPGLRRRVGRTLLAASLALMLLVVPGGTVPPAGAATGGNVVDIDYARPVGDTGGVYITHSDGRVEARDGLPHFGDRPALFPGERIIALSVRPTVDGYWLFTDRGRAFAYGAAGFHGDAGGIALAAPMISAISTPDGLGYYMVAEDGGIFTYGTARYHGSVPEVLPGVALRAPVIGIAPSTTGGGYLLVAADGGIFTFGDAVFYGSVPGVLPGVTLDQPVVGVIPQPSGYLMVAADGGIFTFGTARFHGSLGGTGTEGIVGVAVVPDNSGYLMIDSVGVTYPFGSTAALGMVLYTGVGSRVVAVEKPDTGPILLGFAVVGGGNFFVTAKDAIGDTIDYPVIMGATDARSGLVLLDWGDSGETAFLEITADTTSAWAVGLHPLTHAPVLSRGQSFTNSGPDVFFVDESTGASTLTLTVNTFDHAAVWWYPETGFSDLVVNEIGPFTSQGLISSSFGLVVVDTSSTSWALAVG